MVGDWLGCVTMDLAASAVLLVAVSLPGRTAAGERLGTIPGVVPSLIGDITGCAFRDRCAHRTSDCERSIPQFGTQEHGWSCVLSEGVAA